MLPQPPEGGVADSCGAAGPAAAAAALPVIDGQATMTGKSMSPNNTTTTLPPSQQQGQSRHKVAIVWFRRDLRVSDNPALMAAAAEADFVVRREVYFFLQNSPSSFGGFACSLFSR